MTASMQLLRLGIAASSRLPLPPGAALALESRSLAHLAPGTPVSTWPDLSGTGHHAVQATTTLQPTYRLHGRLPVVEFLGTNDVLDPALVLGSALTIVYVSIPVTDYGALLQDGKRVTATVGNSGVYAYTGRDKPESSWASKWAVLYASPAYLNDGPMTVGQIYATGLAVDATRHTSYFGREVSRTAARAEALGNTTLRVGGTPGGTAGQRLVAIYAWPRRLTTPEYQATYDYARDWIARYGITLP